MQSASGIVKSTPVTFRVSHHKVVHLPILEPAYFCRWGAVLYTLGCVMYIIAIAFGIALDFTSVHISDVGQVTPPLYSTLPVHCSLFSPHWPHNLAMHSH